MTQRAIRAYVKIKGGDERRLVSFTVEAGSLSDAAFKEYTEELPAAVVQKLHTRNLTSFAAGTFMNHSTQNPRFIPTQSDILDKFNIAHQVSLGVCPPDDTFPHANGISYNPRAKGRLGQAITFKLRPPIANIVEYCQLSYYRTIQSHVSTNLHERAHYGELGIPEGPVRSATRSVMMRNGFTYSDPN